MHAEKRAAKITGDWQQGQDRRHGYIGAWAEDYR
jgi:hypothetical protein